MNSTLNITEGLAVRENVFLFSLDEKGNVSVFSSPSFFLNNPGKAAILTRLAEDTEKGERLVFYNISDTEISAVLKIDDKKNFAFWTFSSEDLKRKGSLSELVSFPEFITVHILNTIKMKLSGEKPSSENVAGTTGNANGKMGILLDSMESCFSDLRKAIDSGENKELTEFIYRGEGILRELYKLEYISNLSRLRNSMDFSITASNASILKEHRGHTDIPNTKKSEIPESDHKESSTNSSDDSFKTERKSNETGTTSLHFHNDDGKKIRDEEIIKPSFSSESRFTGTGPRYPGTMERTAPLPQPVSSWKLWFSRIVIIFLIPVLIILSLLVFWNILDRGHPPIGSAKHVRHRPDLSGEILSMLDHAVTSGKPHPQPKSSVSVNGEKTVTHSATPTLMSTKLTTTDIDNVHEHSSNISNSPPSHQLEQESKPISPTEISPTLVDPVSAGLLREGNLTAAAEGWRRSLIEINKPLYTVTVELDCRKSSVMNALRNIPEQDQLFILPVLLGNNQCYRVCKGLFFDKSNGESVLKSLPSEYLQSDYPPAITEIGKILR